MSSPCWKPRPAPAAAKGKRRPSRHRRQSRLRPCRRSVTQASSRCGARGRAGIAQRRGRLEPVTCPDLGDGKAADVIELAVKPGDTVAEGDALLTVETEKAATELPAPFAGTVRELKVKVGDKLKTGDLVAMIETAAAQAPAATQEAAPTPAQAAPAAAPPPLAVAPAPQLTATPHRSGQTPHATPSVRRFARELGVDLSQVGGSGRKGRITQEDVQAFVKSVLQGGAARTGERRRPGPAAGDRFCPVGRDRDRGAQPHPPADRRESGPFLAAGCRRSRSTTRPTSRTWKPSARRAARTPRPAAPS